MKSFSILLFAYAALVAAHEDESTSMDMDSSSDMPVGSMPTSMDTSPDYTITALPAVSSQPSCVFNCLIPIGLADASGCDDVTENCACLSAPADVLDFMTNCVQTVCKSSTSAYAQSATSLYESYCKSVYGTASFSSALAAEASAAAPSTTGSDAGSTTGAATKTSSGSGAAATGGSATNPPAASGSAGPKSGAIAWRPSLFATSVVVGGLAVMIAL